MATPPLLQDAQQEQHSTTHTTAGDTAAAAAAGLQDQPQTLLSQLQQQEHEPLPEDARWLSVSRAHASYLSYMQQLAAMVVSKQQQVHQLVYQVSQTQRQLLQACTHTYIHNTHTHWPQCSQQ